MSGAIDRILDAAFDFRPVFWLPIAASYVSFVGWSEGLEWAVLAAAQVFAITWFARHTDN